VYVHGTSGESKSGKGTGRIWSIHEVDGEQDTLYCQNLCLFAKLFLDTKSVFFDVSSFLYYLLVHTHPTTGEKQVVGFFSKEKMSWDGNNLACILVFPPWQKKALGGLLMAISYEISRREGVLGGPEKPISEMGRVGYVRFWSAEVARWILEQEFEEGMHEMEVSVENIAKGTWICAEDVLCALRAMDVAVPVGRTEDGKERVLIDKMKAKEWAERTRTSLIPVLDPNGWIEGFGMKEVVESEEGE
jgi:hypothetical protein